MVKEAKKGEACWKSWSGSGNPAGNGQCCCNCKSRFTLFSHPWVDKKPFNHRLGYVCVSEGVEKGRATLSHCHGLCELHEFKSKKAEKTAKDRRLACREKESRRSGFDGLVQASGRETRS